MNKVFLDVTHTLESGHTTGVQRVVRELARQAADWPNSSLIRWDPTRHDYLPLSAPEVERLLAAPTVQQARFGPFRRWVRRGLRPWARVRDFWRVQTTKNTLTRQPRQIDFNKGLLVIAEVAGEAHRTTMVQWLLSNTSVRLVLVVHDLIPWSHPRWTTYPAAAFQRYLGLLARATAVVPVSRFTASEVSRWFRDQGRPEPQVHVVYPGVSRATGLVLAPDRESPRFPLLACVGTVEERKNQVLVLKTAKRLWDEGLSFGLLFLGRDSEAGGRFRRLYPTLRRAGYPVAWWNPASENEIAWAYLHASATLFPSSFEGFGLPIAESIAYGTPCVTTGSGAMGELASTLGGCLPVPENDAQGFYCAVKAMLTDEGARERLRDEAVRSGARTWATYAAELREWLEGLGF